MSWRASLRRASALFLALRACDAAEERRRSRATLAVCRRWRGRLFTVWRRATRGGASS
jgi:hypothetical protein